jgi:hypothetical protein
MIKPDNTKLETKIIRELTEVQEGIDLKVLEMVLEEEEEEAEEMKLLDKKLKPLLRNQPKSLLLDFDI